MRATGNIRKMKSTLGEVVEYTLPLFNILEPHEEIPLNQFVGKDISLRFENEINCVITGQKIKKTYGDGMSFKAFQSSPLAVESIIRPELSRIHEGIALRDKEWEEAHHNTPHVTYVSLTSGLKVGVTRTTQIPTRWIDQGAVEAVLLAETPYRQAAGLIEVSLKKHVADKTNWRNMLKNEFTNSMGILEMKKKLTSLIPDDLKQFISDKNEVTKINFPVIEYPQKLTSIKLDKVPVIEKKLMGIKGQYLIFDDNTVMNLRSHTAYKITIEA
jgi:hypothetical protein